MPLKGGPPERGGMSRLGTLVDTKSEAFEKNAEAFLALVDELRKHSAEARRGGGRRPRGGTESAVSCLRASGSIVFSIQARPSSNSHPWRPSVCTTDAFQRRA